ncbi:MAG: IS21 family transposase [Burkholderiales bacterium]|jgi:transposase|nr:IS21 family transposase [Burkholderiales bacterium]
MDMIGKVRRMKLRDQLSLSEISKRTGLARNTVKKWLKAPGDEPPKYERRAVERKLAAFEGTLHQALAADGHRPKQSRRSARALFSQIQAQGYRGGYSAVTDFIRAWRTRSDSSPAKAFVPLSFELGEAFQFDWSDEAMVVGGVFYNVQVAHLKLCASRAFWLVAYPSQGHEMLFDAHTRSFQALGGVARRGIYDNMKTAVDKVKRGKGRIVNARFAAMCSHYLFDPDFCNVASGWEKGVVEKNVQDSRRRIWIEASTRRFGSFIELNAWLAERCRSVWADTSHPIHRQFTVGEMLELERGHLMSMPTLFDGYVERLARVSSTCLVVAARNRYSVPCEWAGHIVSTRVYPERVEVAAMDAVVASHARLSGSGQTVFDWQHYIELVQRKPGALRNGTPFLDLPPALLRLRQSLLRHPGGDRVMAQVLAVVPQAGLEAVLVAVELVLEGMAPSGSISVEHVRNVLARLNNPVTPMQAETALQLTLAPKADTARYDRLRPTHLDDQEVRHA